MQEQKQQQKREQLQQPAVVQQQQIQRSQVDQQRRRPITATARKTPGRVTRVVGDLMIFAEVDENGPFGLVFMPDVIVNYGGERLQDIGVVVGAPIFEIAWDIATRLVSSVVVASSTGAPFRTA